MAVNRSILFRIDESKIQRIMYKSKIHCREFDKQLSDKTRNRIFERTLRLNNNLYDTNTNDIGDMFIKQRWSLQNYDKVNLPIVIGHVDGRKFSQRNNKYLWVMDLPIKMPFSQIKIPIEFSQFTDFFKRSIQFERLINPDFEKCYANLCIDQRPVLPNNYQRRPGWHADSFITKSTHLQYNNNSFSPPMDTVYLAYDCLATEFNKSIFSFSKDVDNHSNDAVLQHFDKMAKPKNVITFPPYTILKMDPRSVHRVQMNNSTRTIDRTFIKLTFTTEIFNRLGNDHNYLFNYNWPLFQRTMERNNSSLFNGLFDESQHKEISKEQLETLFSSCSSSLIENSTFDTTIHKVVKIGDVHIQPTYEGELLLTNENNTFITCNTAKAGEHKITNLNNGTQYFLSMDKIMNFYDLSEISKGIVKPKSIIGHAIKIKSQIKILAPWNAYQYLYPNDYIIKKGNDIYGIKNSDFSRCYKLI
jgi:hypothetical protein